MSEHRNNVANAVSGTPGTGTITLASAVSGSQSFSTAYGANATVDVFITDGTAWEVARNCTYTHSSDRHAHRWHLQGTDRRVGDGFGGFLGCGRRCLRYNHGTGCFHGTRHHWRHCNGGSDRGADRRCSSDRGRRHFRYCTCCWMDPGGRFDFQRVDSGR